MKTSVNEASAKTCPTCGRTLASGAPAGLCPACLLAQGVATESGIAGETTRFTPPPLDQVTELFPQLEILSLLGAGGMGAVYKARQPALDRLVALKILPQNGPGGASFEERFNREARALARLHHPNIVTVHEFGQAGGWHYFIMEFVDGANLRQLEQSGRLAPREALQIIPQICDALQYAHDEGVVHRDIKPENVLVDRKGRVKIADFGLAKILGTDPASHRLTVEGQVMGTPHYMAPEQVERPLAVDHRADIYSLGVVFYEMLTGDLPLGKFAPPSRKVQVDVRLDDIVLRALENDPERRYQQASEVKHRVATVVETPAPGTPQAVSHDDAGAPRAEAQYLRWLGIPVVVERNGEREVNFQGALGAVFVTMLVAALAHLVVRWQTGGEHALSQYVWLAGLLTVVWGIRRTLNQPQAGQPVRAANGTVVLPPTRRLPYLADALMLVGLVAFTIGSHYFMTAARSPASAPKAAQVAQRDPATGRTIAHLPGRGTVELLALKQADGAANGWWNADGQPITNTTYEVKGGSDVVTPGRDSTDVLLRVLDLPGGASGPLLETDPTAGTSGGGDILNNGVLIRGGSAIRFAWPTGTQRATLRAGFGLDPWRTVSTYDLSSGRFTADSQPDEPQWGTTFHPPVDLGDKVQVTVVIMPDSRDWQTQLTAVDKEGVPHSYNQARGTPTGSSSTWTYIFPRLSLADVKEFRMQARRVHWIEFPNLALQPSGPLPEAFVQQKAFPNPATGTLIARLPNGGTVEMMAVAEVGAAPNQWWRPLGQPITDTTYALINPVESRADGDSARNVIVRRVGLAEDAAGPFFEANGVSWRGSGGAVSVNGRLANGFSQAGFVWPASTEQDDIRVGFALDPWRTVATHDPNNHRNTSSPLPTDPQWSVTFHDSSEGNDGVRTTLVMARESRNWLTRVIAIDHAGTLHTYRSGQSTLSGDLRAWTYTFREVALKDIREFQVQVRPMRWIDFPNVQLNPRSALPAAEPLRFGAVIERHFDELIDFDTGRIAEFPANKSNENPFAGVGESVLWAQQQGFDACAGNGELQNLNTEFLPLTATDWDSLTPQDVINRLHQESTRPGVLGPFKASDLPATYAYRTREQGYGLVQLTAFDPQRPGATIRVKPIAQSWANPSVSLPPSKLPELTPDTAAFGPVLERDVLESPPEQPCWFDLDQGISVNLADYDRQGLLNSPKPTTQAENDFYQEKFKRLKVDSGIDVNAMLDGVPPGFGRPPGLIHKEMIFVPAPSQKWTTLTPSELRAALSGKVASPRTEVAFQRNEPATYLFQTFEGGTGILQLTGFTNKPRSIHIRYRLLASNQAEAAKPAPAPQTSAPEAPPGEAPQLRFVAWQHEFQTNGAAAVHLPDGTKVTGEANLKRLRLLDPARVDVSATDAGKRDPRFAHFWISHPGFDARSQVGLELLGTDGKVIPLAADGTTSTSVKNPADVSDENGWLLSTLSPGEGQNVPEAVTLRLHYAVGLWERVRKVPSDFNGGMALPVGQVTAVGNGPNGRSFLALAADTKEGETRQIGVIAVTRNQRKFASKGSVTMGSGKAGLRTERFEFEPTLAEVDHFEVGTRPIQSVTWTNVVLTASARDRAENIRVERGGTFPTVQAALDAAPLGATITLPSGVFAGNLVITKAVNLKGAGADKTIFEPAEPWREPSKADLKPVEESLRAAKSEAEREAIRAEASEQFLRPVLRIRGADSVQLSGIGFRQAGAPGEGKTLPGGVIDIANATVSLQACAIVSSPVNGLVAGEGADVHLTNCLIAAVWNTGVQAGAGSKVEVIDSDVRNCFYAGITAGRGATLTVSRSRISGAAWHGIRYDHISPVITDNLIFGNARSGIYASGNTKATVRGNVFFENEMNGISCWYNNQDEITGNTFSGNLREALSVLGGSSPVISSNIFHAHKVAITQGFISGRDQNQRLGQLNLLTNIFWANATNLTTPELDPDGKPVGLSTNLAADTGSRFVNPGLRDPTAHDFRSTNEIQLGATSPLPFASAFPLQPEEQSMVPTGASRDSRSWKRPATR